ncbi:MAG: site-specific integrase [Candidatus Omnitrophica bacterium]|nr:site-specific integrase [Candidatus Omnitrophota bacterium]
MQGKVHFRPDRNFYYVQWTQYKISRYKGFLCRDGEISGMTGEQMANRLLAVIQGDFDSCASRNLPFSIAKYLEQNIDTIPYLRKWLKANQKTLSPATYRDYNNSIENHLIPWLKENKYRLHELKYDVLCDLLDGINRAGKGKKNVMYCLHKCLDDALKSEHILSMPRFPEKKKYRIIKKKRKGLPSDRQEKIFDFIPKEHLPIFLFLKYHFRRPSEACALHKIDYDRQRDLFVIRRTFSNKVLVDYTKTDQEHEIPCNPLFKPIMEAMPKTFGPFFFENPSRDCKTKNAGRHYTISGLEHIWNKARDLAGETISLYPGTKHSSCWQFLNEKGGTKDELQALTDHANRESVDVYADMEIDRKRSLMVKFNKVQIAPGLPQPEKEASNQ